MILPRWLWPGLLVGGVLTAGLVYHLGPSWWPLSLAGAVGLVTIVTVSSFAPHWQFYGRALSRGRAGAVALTFDDGPHPEHTLAVCDLIEADGGRGTFFFVGTRAESHPDIVKAVFERGHQVAFHGHTHRWQVMMSPGRFASDFDAGMNAVHAAVDRWPRFYRPPLGLVAPPVYSSVRRWGAEVAGWSVRPYDGGHADAATVVERVLSKIRGGDVVLMHDVAGLAGGVPTALAALPPILEGLRERGLDVVTMADLTGRTAYLEAPMALETRPRRSFLEVATAFTVALLLFGAIGGALADEGLPVALLEECASLAEHATVEAKFEQSKTSVLFATEEVRTGRLRLRRSDGRLLWAYDDGPEFLMAEGRFFPAGKSKEELGPGAAGWAPPGAERSSRIMGALFSLDPAALGEYFSAAPGADGVWVLTPKAKAAQAMFARVELTVSGSPRALTRVVLHEASGDHNELVFSEHVLGGDLDDALFLTPAERSAAP